MDLRSLCDAVSAGEEFEYLLFWGHTPKVPRVIDATCLSQWYPAPFTVDGVTYATAEHWMMAAKARLFGDDDALARILASTDPREVKALGRAVRGFDTDRWDAHRLPQVVEGNVHKFGQSEPLRSFLLATGDRVLVEASPRDRIWGIGMGASNERARDPREWRGKNLLGFALMEARTQLRAEGESR
ncbi:MAG: NADAR family protein [Myxococcota bacterium]|nr:NADAR family protein [Myxococcota bacterium]